MDWMDECAEKHCEEPATIGTTRTINGVELEIYLCDRHFEAIEDLSRGGGLAEHDGIM